MKTRVVVFQPEGGARVYINEHMDTPGALINPLMGHVRGVSPSHWKLNGAGEIVPMTDAEKALVTQPAREGEQLAPAQHIEWNKIKRPRRVLVVTRSYKWAIALSIANALATIVLAVLQCI